MESSLLTVTYMVSNLIALGLFLAYHFNRRYF